MYTLTHNVYHIYRDSASDQRNVRGRTQPDGVAISSMARIGSGLGHAPLPGLTRLLGSMGDVQTAARRDAEPAAGMEDTRTPSSYTWLRGTARVSGPPCRHHNK
jgi:hypothetical protein